MDSIKLYRGNMKSASKIPVTYDDVLHLVQNAFGQEINIESYEELTQGFFNVAYLIKIKESNGIPKEVVLKIAPPSSVPLLTYENQMMLAEKKFMDIVSELNLPFPKVLFFDDSQKIIPRTYFFMEKCEGILLKSVKSSLSLKENDEIEYQLGQIISKINTIRGTYFGYIMMQDHPENKTWRTTFNQMVTWMFDDIERFHTKIPIKINQLKTIFNKYASYLDVITEPQLVHMDIWIGNVFVKKNGSKYEISGIIDGERALFGDPMAEFVFMHIPKINGIIKGIYENKSPIFTKAMLIRRSLYTLYLSLLMLIEDDSRKYGFAYLRTKIWLRQSIKKICKTLNT